MIEVGLFAVVGVTTYLIFKALNKSDKNGLVRWRKYYRPALDAFSSNPASSRTSKKVTKCIKA
jgi:hypothetical protein